MCSGRVMSKLRIDARPARRVNGRVFLDGLILTLAYQRSRIRTGGNVSFQFADESSNEPTSMPFSSEALRLGRGCAIDRE